MKRMENRKIARRRNSERGWNRVRRGWRNCRRMTEKETERRRRRTKRRKSWEKKGFGMKEE